MGVDGCFGDSLPATSAISNFFKFSVREENEEPFQVLVPQVG